MAPRVSTFLNNVKLSSPLRRKHCSFSGPCRIEISIEPGSVMVCNAANKPHFYVVFYGVNFSIIDTRCAVELVAISLGYDMNRTIRKRWLSFELMGRTFSSIDDGMFFLLYPRTRPLVC